MTAAAKTWRWCEMIALFVGGPMLLWSLPGVLAGPRLFLFLLAIGLLCTVGLFFDTKFDRHKLWNAQPIGRAMGRIVLRWAIACALLTALFGLFAGRVLPSLPIPVPTGLFGIFYRQPPTAFVQWVDTQAWMPAWLSSLVLDAFPMLVPTLILLLYPWLSVYPQNVVYRAFFCQRYRPILGGGWVLIVANAAAFALGHVMFNNWVVLGLTFVGGLLFTHTYLKHRSLLLATIEHAMYGLYCFYLGIGIFLLYGATG